MMPTDPHACPGPCPRHDPGEAHPLPEGIHRTTERSCGETFIGYWYRYHDRRRGPFGTALAAVQARRHDFLDDITQTPRCTTDTTPIQPTLTPDGTPLVTVDDDDRATCPDTPWTVSCAACQLGVAFACTQERAYREAAAHLSAHRISDPEDPDHGH